MRPLGGVCPQLVEYCNCWVSASGRGVIGGDCGNARAGRDEFDPIGRYLRRVSQKRRSFNDTSYRLEDAALALFKIVGATVSFSEGTAEDCDHVNRGHRSESRLATFFRSRVEQLRCDPGIR